MKRNAIIRIVLWSTVLLVLLSILFILVYVPGAGNILKRDEPVEATMVPVRLTLVPDADAASANAITVSSANVRSTPETTGEAVAFAERGTKLQILRQEQIGGKKWGYIGAPTMGWIDMKYVSMLEPVAEETAAATEAPVILDEGQYNAVVTANGLNVRTMPSSEAPVAGMVEEGDQLLITRQETVNEITWGYISAPVPGWVQMEYVELLAQASTEAPVILDEGQYNAIVTSEGLNVRTMPSMESPTAGHVEKGDHLLITKQETVNEITWGYTPAPINGWVVMKYVELLEETDVEITTMETTASQEPEITGYGVALDAASIREIEIEWVAGSIRIQPKAVTEIRITEEGKDQDKYPMVWKVRDRKLAIQYAETKKNSTLIGISRSSISKDLIIEVPLDWTCDDLEIAAASATVEISDLNIREMEFDGASGTCTFVNCSVETLDVDTASGNVRFTGDLQQMDCDAVSADILLELTNVPKSIDLDSASGNLDVTLPADAGFTVTLDTLSGDFKSNFTTTKRNGSYVAGNGRCRIDVDAMSGDVTVLKGT